MMALPTIIKEIIGINAKGNNPVDKEIKLGRKPTKIAPFIPKSIVAIKRVALTIEPVIICCLNNGAIVATPIKVANCIKIKIFSFFNAKIFIFSMLFTTSNTNILIHANYTNKLFTYQYYSYNSYIGIILSTTMI